MQYLFGYIIFVFLSANVQVYSELNDNEYDEDTWSYNVTTSDSFDVGMVAVPTITTLQGAESTYESHSSDEESDFCSQPPKIERAKYSHPLPKTLNIGTTVFYECEFGYIGDGAKISTECKRLPGKKSPTWTDIPLHCTARSCGDPGLVPNAHRTGFLFTFANSVEFECKEGFQIKGPSKRYCLASGTWSGKLPTCERVFCNVPSDIEHGKAIYPSLEFGTELKYECNQGYVLKAKESRYCSSDGKWSGKRPRCQDAKCDIPSAPIDGTVEIIGGEPQIDSIALFKCNENKKLVGSSKSKCLDNGEWMFPTPKCTDPCKVPKVDNGKIGKYFGRYKKTFRPIPENTILEPNDELILICESSYEPLGRQSIEERVTCSYGEWKEMPQCLPASCRSSPPATENADVVNVQRLHGGGVTYGCRAGFTKRKHGNVTCHYGAWRGYRPVCADTRCDRNSLQFRGLLVPEQKRYYLSGESFTVACDKGYEVTHPNARISCRSKWEGTFPPCVAASCLKEPPRIQNGYPKEHQKLHSSFVTYACSEPYFLVGQSTVQCLFGEWVGKTPVCTTYGCSFRNLIKKEGVVAKNDDITGSGDELEFRCAEGYFQNGLVPFCVKGEWERNERSPCTERNCEITIVDGGWLVRKETSNWFGIRYKREKIGLSKDPKHELFVECQSNLSFQGKGQNFVKVNCVGGSWMPKPFCLKNGTKLAEETTTEIITTLVTDFPLTAIDEEYPSSEIPAPTEQSLDHETAQLNISLEQPKVEKECFCIFIKPRDENLVSFVGKKILQEESIVKRGCKVQFHCSPLGYNHLRGPAELKCVDCRPWHSKEYPTCETPSHGDAIVFFPQSTIAATVGILEIKAGGYLSMGCYASPSYYYPTWNYPTREDVQIDNHIMDDEVGSIYISYLSIFKARPEHSGYYSCVPPRDRSKQTIYIQVPYPIVKCLPFVESSSLVVTYTDNNLNVNSTVQFSCRNPNEILDGFPVLTCLANGQWSDHAPRCIVVCPKLNETDSLTISYQNPQLRVGTVAAFHCLLPYSRSGVSKAHCLGNGKWSDPAATCILPSCRLESLMDKVPNDVQPDMNQINSESVAYGSLVPLTCKDNLKLIGPQSAKCLGEENWELLKVRCISGCPPVEKLPNSDIIINPDKDFYQFGEFVSISCPPGKILSSEVVRLMCLSDGWSEKEQSTCQLLEE